MPGAMSGRRGSGPRARAASTEDANAAARSAGRLRSQALSISLTRSVSPARRSRSCRECFAIRTSLRVRTRDGCSTVCIVPPGRRVGDWGPETTGLGRKPAGRPMLEPDGRPAPCARAGATPCWRAGAAPPDGLTWFWKGRRSPRAPFTCRFGGRYGDRRPPTDGWPPPRWIGSARIARSTSKPATTSRSIRCRSNASMSPSRRVSSTHTRETASPSSPARPVRPIRWT